MYPAAIELAEDPASAPCPSELPQWGVRGLGQTMRLRTTSTRHGLRTGPLRILAHAYSGHRKRSGAGNGPRPHGRGMAPGAYAHWRIPALRTVVTIYFILGLPKRVFPPVPSRHVSELRAGSTRPTRSSLVPAASQPGIYHWVTLVEGFTGFVGRPSRRRMGQWLLSTVDITSDHMQWRCALVPV